MSPPEPREAPIFRRLDPPPGGLQGLRRRLDRRAARREVLLPALGLAAACAVAVITVFLPRPPGGAPGLSFPDDPALTSLGLHVGVSDPVSVPPDRAGDIALLRRESGVPGVMYYRVSVRGAGGAEGAAR